MRLLKLNKTYVQKKKKKKKKKNEDNISNPDQSQSNNALDWYSMLKRKRAVQ
jgi:hypothetical protein